jgi:hypothetical protein
MATVITQREALGLDESGRARSPTADQRATGAMAVETLSSAVARGVKASGHAPLPMPPFRDMAFDLPPCPCRGGCGQTLPFPGLCDPCARRMVASDCRAFVVARALERIPREYVDARWETLPTLESRDGGLRVRESPERLLKIREAIENEPWVILTGPSGVGKSTIAACHTRALLECGVEAYFVEALELHDDDDGQELCERLLDVPHLVYDDLGGELLGAPLRGGIAAIRSRLGTRLLAHRFSRHLPTVVTCGRVEVELLPIYGPLLTRRLFGGILQIPIGRRAI